MSVPVSKILIHGIIPVSGRLPLINSDNETFVCNTLRECFNNQSSEILSIAALAEHVHILFGANAMLSLSDIVRNVCAESVEIINQRFFKARSFAWEERCFLFSVSQSQIQKVSEYIENQKVVHAEKSLGKEIEDFLVVHGIK